MRVVDPKIAFTMLHREVSASQTPFHQQFQAPISSSNGGTIESLSIYI
jgi:hypothetical protein